MCNDRVLIIPSIFTYLSANLAPDVVQKLPDELQTGIYFGWANVDDGQIYKAVLSLGWNPFFKNKEKSLVSIVRNERFIPLVIAILIAMKSSDDFRQITSIDNSVRS